MKHAKILQAQKNQMEHTNVLPAPSPYSQPFKQIDLKLSMSVERTEKSERDRESQREPRCCLSLYNNTQQDKLKAAPHSQCGSDAPG